MPAPRADTFQQVQRILDELWDTQTRDGEVIANTVRVAGGAAGVKINGGLVTVNAGGGLVIPHGLGVVPRTVDASPNRNDLVVITFNVGVPDATEFTLRNTSGTNSNFFWIALS